MPSEQFKQGFGEGLKGLGAWWAGKGPSYEVARTDRLEQQQEQEQLRKREKVISALTVFDVLKTQGQQSALQFLERRIDEASAQGADATDLNRLYTELRGANNPEALASIVKDGARLEREAQMRGWMDAPKVETGYFSPVTGSDGRRYGIDKSNPNAGYVLIPSPEGVTFDSGGQDITVNAGGPPPRGTFFTSQVEGATETLGQIRSESRAAQTRLPAITALKGMDIETGFGTPARTALARATNFFFGEGSGDIFNSDISATEAFQALSQKMVNEELNLAKGPQTEGDAIRARQTVASLEKAPEANKFLLSYYEGLARRQIERNQFFERYMNTGPDQTDEQGLGAFREAEQEWLKFKESTPLVSVAQGDGRILTYAGTKIPMVYYDFEKMFLQKNGDQLSGMSMREKREAAQQAWRQANGIQ